MLPAYAELHCLSNFSFLRGASHPEELATRAATLGYAALAITDECSLAGVVRAHLAAKDAGLKLIVGTEIRLEDGPNLVLLATNREGYGNLSALVTKGRRRADKGTYRLARADLDDGLPHCLALLVPDDSHSATHERATSRIAHHPSPITHHLSPPTHHSSAITTQAVDARWLAARFPGRAWIAAELLLGPDDKSKLAALVALSRSSGLPLVGAGDVRMHVRSRKRLHDVLTAIRLGKPVAECGADLLPNAERHLRLRLRLARIYPPELLAETVAIAERCAFSLDELRYEYPDEIVPAGETPASWLRKLVCQGLAWRFACGPAPGSTPTLTLPLPGGGNPPRTSPSPSQGEGWDGGSAACAFGARQRSSPSTPTQTLPLPGGGNSPPPSPSQGEGGDGGSTARSMPRKPQLDHPRRPQGRK